MNIHKKVFYHALIYIGSVVLTGCIAAILHVFEWRNLAIGILLFIFSVGSFYSCVSFFKVRSEYKIVDKQLFSTIRWKYHWERIIITGILGALSLFLGIIIFFFI